MQMIKKYLVWFVLAAIFLVLLLVQLFYVGGLRSEAAENNKKVAKKVEDLQKMARSLKNYPTALDLEKGKQHLDLIREEGTNVQASWRKLTSGMNKYMSNGTREDGQITNPETDEPVRWDYFATFLVKSYKKLFTTMEKKMVEVMTPAVLRRMADDYYAVNETITDRKQAYAQVEKQVARNVATLSNIVNRPGVLWFNENENFRDEGGDFDLAKCWRYWRYYLVTEDILARAVPASSANIKRLVNEHVRKEGGEDEAEDELALNKKTVETVVAERDDTRFIESISVLKVEGPEYGNAELPGADGKLPEKKDEKKPARPSRHGVVEKEETKYEDVFTVTIRMSAHMKVVRSFMTEILKSPDIFYVPVSVTIERAQDSVAMGVYDPNAEETGGRTNTGDMMGMGESRRGGAMAQLPDEDTSRPVRRTVGFGYEPPVDVTLVYKVYRFRYADTDNTTPDEEEETERNFGPGRGRL